MGLTLESQIFSFGLNDTPRRYMVVTVPYVVARERFKPDRYKALTGEGEQRDVFDAHVKKIKAAIKANAFTPTPITVGIPASLRAKLPTDFKETFKLELSDGEALSLLDGGHRTEALERIFKESNDDLKAKVLALPITALIMLDGNTKTDFLNLQLGRTVDRSHILSLSIQEKTTDKKNSEHFQFALQVARLLTSNDKSPFYKQIRFDSSGTGLPISTLSSKGASDIGTSLVGAAKVTALIKKDAKWYADLFVQVYETIQKFAKELTELGKPLTPPPDGSKGAATMYVGLTNLMAYRLHAFKNEAPDAADLQILVNSAKKTLNELVKGNFSGPAKRSMLGDFADKFFADVEGNLHYGVPVELIRTLSTSTFAVAKLPKEKKKPGRKKAVEAPKKPEVEPDFDNAEVLPHTEKHSWTEGVAVVTEEMPDGTPVESADWQPEADAPWDSEAEA